MKFLRYGHLLLGLTAAPVVFAQLGDEAGPPDGETFELSPFNVNAADDNGYHASQTLAGSRVKANLRDLATSISIVTEDYLDDTNATDLAGVLLYQGNTEVSGLSGNFSGSQGVTPGAPIGELARDNFSGGVTRVRGLAAADLTRDFFRTSIPMDAYNTTRVEVQRGANAVLFGMGSPGGIVNNTLLKPYMEGNYGRLRFQVDQYGSVRGDARYNAEVVDDVFAIAVAGLAEDEKYQQNEAYMEDQRVYASVLLQPLDDKTFKIRLSGEAGKRDGAPPRMMPPGDMISHYYALRDAGLPVFESGLAAEQWYSGTGDIYPGVNNNVFLQTMGGANGPTVFWLDPQSASPDPLGTSIIQNANELADTTPEGDTHRRMFSIRNYNNIIRAGGIYPDTGNPLAVPGSGTMWDNRTDRQITDRSIFDYREHMLDGGLSTQFSRFEDIIASVEKTFLDNRFGFELAYHTESFRAGQLNILRGDPGGESIILDINPYLGAGDPTLGVPVRENPNFGRLAVASRAENEIVRDNRESTRLTGFAELRAEDFLREDSWLERGLGRLIVTGVYQTRDTDSYTIYTRDTTSPDDVYAQFRGDDPQASFVASSFYLGQYHALDYEGFNQGVRPIDFTSADQLRGLNIQPVNGAQRMPESHRISMLNLSTQTFEEAMLSLHTATDNGGFPATYSGSKSLSEIKSQVFNGTWHLLDDLVVLQYAWRKDEEWTGSAGAPTYLLPDGTSTARDDIRDPNFYVAETAKTSENESDGTWGIVVHTPEFIRGHLPLGLDLSLHYGESENFQPTGAHVNIYNERIGAVTGATEEWGFTVSALENRILARVNFYETGILNNRLYVSPLASTQTALLNLAHQLNNPDNVAQGFTVADVQAVLPAQGVLDVQGAEFDWNNPDNSRVDGNPDRNSTQDFVSEGMEIELLFTPTRNWTNIVKVARQETMTANSAPALRAWFADFVEPNWINSNFAQNYWIDDSSTQTLSQWAVQNIQDPLVQAESLDNRPTTEQREWRVIATSKYRFEEIFDRWGMDAVEFGGTYRYESRAGIGYAAALDQFGRVVPDVANPYYAPSQAFVDLFVNLETEIWGLETVFQLYVSDLTNHDDLVPVHANPDNTRTYRILEGRLVSLSATVNF